MAEEAQSQNRPWECLICSTIFQSKSALRHHIEDTYPVLEIWFIEGHMDAMKSCTMCQQAGTGLIDSWLLICGAYCTLSGCGC